MLSINSGLNGKELKELILNYADEISMSYDGATHTVKKLNAYDSVLALRGTTFKTENVTSDSLKITGIEGEMPERLIIPEKIIGKKVVSIAQNAFLRCENIKSLKFSNISTLRTIGVSAFGECKNLTEVVFPDSVTKIDCAAFIDCKNLKSIIFSDDSELNVIEVAAFGGVGRQGVVEPDFVEEHQVTHEGVDAGFRENVAGGGDEEDFMALFVERRIDVDAGDRLDVLAEEFDDFLEGWMPRWLPVRLQLETGSMIQLMPRPSSCSSSRTMAVISAVSIP